VSIELEAPPAPGEYDVMLAPASAPEVNVAAARVVVDAAPAHGAGDAGSGQAEHL
jgi:hypothetical protein